MRDQPPRRSTAKKSYNPSPQLDLSRCWSSPRLITASTGPTFLFTQRWPETFWLRLASSSYFCLQRKSFASATIEVAPEQKVVSTGLYAFVRHPMYMGGLFLFVGMSLALGSWWGLLATIPITLVMVWRLLEEERFLVKRLPGYSEYRNKVRYRLIPLIW